MTEAENHCAGYVGMSNNRFREDDPAVQRCMDTTQKDNTEHSIANSVLWACTGIVESGWDGLVLQCQDIFEQNQLWMLVGGGFTTKWSDAYPRPVPLDEGVIVAPPTRSNRSSDVDVGTYGAVPQTEEDESDE